MGRTGRSPWPTDSAIYHTYSCYSRGPDTLNGAYQLLDLVLQAPHPALSPEGRGGKG